MQTPLRKFSVTGLPHVIVYELKFQIHVCLLYTSLLTYILRQLLWIKSMISKKKKKHLEQCWVHN